MATYTNIVSEQSGYINAYAMRRRLFVELLNEAVTYSMYIHTNYAGNLDLPRGRVAIWKRLWQRVPDFIKFT